MPKATANSIPVWCAHDEIGPLEKAIENPRNPNKHPEAQIKLLANIMKVQGIRNPITISKRSGFITKGAGRKMAALLNGWTEFPFDYQDYESEAAEYADLIADNRIAELSEPDLDLVKDILDSVEALDAGLTGYDPAELGLDDEEPLEDPGAQIDKAEELQHKWNTEYGQVWEIPSKVSPGKSHRLMCGDSKNCDDISKLMDGSRADMVFTSPPYNVGIKYSQHDDKQSDDDYLQLINDVAENCYLVLNDGRLMAWNVGVSPKSKPHRHIQILEEMGFSLYRQIVWKKTGAQIPLWQNSKKKPCARHYMPNYNHELIYMVSKGDVELGSKTDMPEELSMDVWDVSQFSAGGHDHPAAFPVKLSASAIQVMSSPGEVYFEPFSGSGTAIIASEQTGRICFGMEIDPKYCAVILQRCLDAGLEPKLM